MARVLLDTYRRFGADPPFGDPRRPHGVAMEGWFWRLTAVESGDVVVVLAAVNRDARGAAWGTAGVAAHPGGFSEAVVTETALARPDGSVVLGETLRFAGRRVTVRLPDASLDVEWDDDGGAGLWPRRAAFGALGPAQSIPGLSQYWHPWLLRARASGHAVVGGREISLDGATVYAEKNWSNGGFPERWWWGQSHGFDGDPDACVAFAGGLAGVGPFRLTATSLVVHAAGSIHRLIRPLQPLRVDVGTDSWRLSGRSTSGVSVVVEGTANGIPPHRLPVPIPGERRHAEQAATQHLAGSMTLTLRRRTGVVFHSTSLLAGLEHGST